MVQFVVHNTLTAQNSSDNLSCYPSDNQHCSAAVHQRGEATVIKNESN